MIRLTKKELFDFIQKSLHDDYKIIATNINVCVDWTQMSHDRTNKIYFFDGTKDWIPFISYHDGYTFKNLTVAEVKMYIEYVYNTSSHIHLGFRIKDDHKLLKTETPDEWRELADLYAEIEFEDEVENLTKEDILELIEFALEKNDKEYFQELVDRFKKLEYNKDKENA